jgi:hypothetical protein
LNDDVLQGCVFLARFFFAWVGGAFPHLGALLPRVCVP